MTERENVPSPPLRGTSPIGRGEALIRHGFAVLNFKYISSPPRCSRVGGFFLRIRADFFDYRSIAEWAADRYNDLTVSKKTLNRK